MRKLPEGWQIKHLDEVSKVVNGGTPKTKVDEYWGGSHRWITPAEMGHRSNPYVSKTQRTLSDAGLRTSSAQIVPPLSVILSTRAPIGHLVINTEPMATNQGCRSLIPHENLNDKFLFYFLWSSVNLLNNLGTGATFKELSAGKLKGVKIPLPPLPEQKRIVAILDEVFAGITRAVANAKKNLTNTRELFESYLNNVFTQKGEGWVEKRLGDICSIKHGFAFKSQFFAGDGDYVLLTPGSFYENGGYRNQGNKTKYYIGEIPDDYILNKGIFLIAMTEQAVGLLGSSMIVPLSNRFLHNQRLGLVQIDDSMHWNNDFFYHQFNTTYFRDAVQSTASGVKVRHTSPTKLEAISISFPTKISEQKRIASILNNMKSETQHLESIYQQTLTALAELKQSTLQKAFSGELTSEATTSPEFAAKVLAFAYDRHASKKRDKTFGRVKAQKILHLAESIGGIDLGREPRKDAAGPNDFKHMLKAEEWAKENLLFEFQERERGYDFKKLSRYNDMKNEALLTIQPYRNELEKVINLIIPMNSQEAEVFATVHAAWNNLILDGKAVDNQKIIHEARESWHHNKMNIPESEFRKAIRFIRDKNLVPDGQAKRVIGEERLL